MKSRSWLNLVDAVRTVRDRRGTSDGAACTLLCQACESGVVRSRKRPWPEQPDEPPEPIYDHWSPPISKLDWYGASIDLQHSWLILAGDTLLRADVEINADDLRHWLGTEEAEFDQIPKRAGKRGRKPVKLEDTKTRMREALANGGLTKMELRGIKEESLAEQFGRVSRETARKARDAVLSEFGANSITDK
jgi:hypothetical protein